MKNNETKNMTNNTKYYIAYGSNLSIEQMAYRCPDARVVGTAVLEGWQLVMCRFATIVPNPAKNTPVLIWEISEKDEQNLDRYEGFPSFYYKKELPVEVFPMEGGEPIQLEAMVYIMSEYPKRLPSESYYEVLKAGYEAFHFPLHVLEASMKDAKKNEGKPVLPPA